MITFEVLKPDDKEKIKQVYQLIHVYAEMGLMLEQTVDFFIQLATSKLLMVAVDENGLVVGSAGLTYDLGSQLGKPGVQEFGAWAISQEQVGKGLGGKLFDAFFTHVATLSEINGVIAYANNNSLPVLLKVGGEVIDQASLPDEMFVGCKRCSCKGKEHLKVGQKCVDVLVDLTSKLEKYRTI